MSNCALALRATTELAGRPPLAVSRTLIDESILIIERTVVTTNYANCTQCAEGKYQDLDSEQLYRCIDCPTGYYGAGAYQPLVVYIHRHANMRSVL